MGATPKAASKFGDMVSNSGLTPWHGIGTVIDEAYTSGQRALELARLDWDVRKGVLIDGETFEPIDKRFVLKADVAVRDAAGQVVREWDAESREMRPALEAVTVGVDSNGAGTPQIVSDTYEIIQNSALAETVDALSLNVQTAGTMYNGRLVWMLADLGESARFDGSGEDMHRWLLLTTDHGNGPFRIHGVNVRVVCENTLSAAVSGGDMLHTIRHTSSAEERIADAREALTETYTAFDEFDAAVQKLIDQPYSTEQMRREMMPAVFGPMPHGPDASDRKRQAAATKRKAIGDIWRSDTVQANKWGAVMAVNEYEQHIQGTPSFSRTATKAVENDWPLTRKALAVVS